MRNGRLNGDLQPMFYGRAKFERSNRTIGLFRASQEICFPDLLMEKDENMRRVMTQVHEQRWLVQSAQHASNRPLSLSACKAPPKHKKKESCLTRVIPALRLVLPYCEVSIWWELSPVVTPRRNSYIQFLSCLDITSFRYHMPVKRQNNIIPK